MINPSHPGSYSVSFDTFTIDKADESLWKGFERIALRPKSFALLRLLVDNQGCLVTKEQLTKHLWPNCIVGDGVLKHCISEVRNALSDSAEKPRLIETVHRRGYRFIGTASLIATPDRYAELAYENNLDNYQLIGRSDELSMFSIMFNKSLKGIRQILLLLGEPGSGKSALVDTFRKQVIRNGKSVLISRGLCIRPTVKAEILMPFCEVIQALWYYNNRGQIGSILHKYSPHWLLEPQLEVNQVKVKRSHPLGSEAIIKRLFQEIAEAIEVMTYQSPLILIIEDVQWADRHTLELISYLGQRLNSARLLLIATCCQTEKVEKDSALTSLRNSLRGKTHSYHELLLPLFTEMDVNHYLIHRFPNHSFPNKTARWIRQLSRGNPSIMIKIVEQMVADGRIMLRSGSWSIRRPGATDRA